ncbi:hypothetical protein PT282_00925 [Bifidobacterium sp. ESL0763]|uniref:hypothetical protein n=1 Tax=Bifidobacterium sp. ESL0763 TaxID=2983227 RepID=UPI0023F9455B|nr:hypothetical protein [Bifidobacterium sp. ESL0763]MDF7663245.1 hypothetical protein [Bifidobacterium sp. ESL0763]
MKRVKGFSRLSSQSRFAYDQFQGIINEAVAKDAGATQTQVPISYDMNVAVSAKENGFWPVVVTAEMTATFSKKSGGASSKREPFMLMRVEYGVTLDDNSVETDAEKDEVRSLVWPYCKDYFDEQTRYIPVPTPDLPLFR